MSLAVGVVYEIIKLLLLCFYYFYTFIMLVIYLQPRDALYKSTSYLYTNNNNNNFISQI